MTASRARSASAPCPVSRRPGPRSRRGPPTEKRGELGEGGVSDLAAGRSAQRPRLTDREWREVVVMHVALRGLIGEAVDLLRVAHRAQLFNSLRMGRSEGEE